MPWHGSRAQTGPMTARRMVGVALCAVAVLTATACGGDDDDAGSGGASAAPGLAEVQACLESGGFTTSTDSVIPEEARKALGIKDSLTINGDGDLFGLGSMTWYVNDSTAKEAHEAGAAVRSEDVARAVQGPIAWDYAGSDAAVAVIEGCVAGGS